MTNYYFEESGYYKIRKNIEARNNEDTIEEFEKLFGGEK